MTKKPSTISDASLEAAKKKFTERARARTLQIEVESIRINVYAIAQHQKRANAMLQEISSELSEANDTLAAILKATQKAR